METKSTVGGSIPVTLFFSDNNILSLCVFYYYLLLLLLLLLLPLLLLLLNCLLSSSSISTWGTIKTNACLYMAIQYLHNGV